MYSDPTAYAKKIQEQTKAEIRAEQEAEKARATRLNQTVTQLTQQYPELNDPNNQLTRKVYEIYNQLDASEQSPTAVKAAVLEAASELGVQPYSKRQKNDDSFSLGGNTGSQTKSSSKKEDADVSDTTLKWAELLGMDTSNKAIRERLKNSAKRQNWMKYE